MAVLAPPTGSLNVPLTIEAPTTVTQPDRSRRTTWLPDVTRWRANIRQLRGNELVAAQQMQGAATLEVTGRYLPSVTSKHRLIKPDGTVLDIVSVDNVEDRNVTLKVRCKEHT